VWEAGSYKDKPHLKKRSYHFWGRTFQVEGTEPARNLRPKGQGSSEVGRGFNLRWAARESMEEKTGHFFFFWQYWGLNSGSTP
jgi:hypothetical protein